MKYTGFWLAVAALSATALVLLTTGRTPSVKLEAPPPTVARQMAVGGEATLRLRPEVAVLRLVVVSEGPTPDGAIVNGLALVRQVEAALRSRGIPEASVHRALDTVRPPAAPGHFAAQYNLEVTVRLDDIDDALAAAFGAGTQSVGAIAYTLQNPEKSRQEALAAAVANARERAQAVAAASGIKLLQMVRVEAEIMAGGNTAGPPAGRNESPDVTIRAQARVTYQY